MLETYVYKVRDRQGGLLRGSLEADSPALVVTRLREMGYIPLSVDRQSGATLKADVKIPFLGNRVKLEELAVFSRQFATMIDSGLTLLRTLAVLAEQTESKVLATVLNDVRKKVEGGASLSQAMAGHPKVFPRIYLAMVRAGEVGGGLDLVLLQLANTLEKQVALRRKIRSAMTYPAAVLVLVVVILTAMLVFVVPTFKSIFKSLGGTLPLPTQILITLSDNAVIFIPLMLVASALGLFIGRKWVATPRGRNTWDGLKLHFPVFGRLTHKSAIARMARTLSALTKAGVPLIESLEITKETSGNAIVAAALSDVQEGVSGGESIAHRLLNHDVIPPMVAQMVAVGEESGALDTMLDKVALFYEGQVESLVASMASLLEPIMVTVLGGIVGSMVISLYLPMFKVIDLVH